MFDTTKTVREYALEIPAATRIFEKLGIDYCCGAARVWRMLASRPGSQWRKSSVRLRLT